MGVFAMYSCGAMSRAPDRLGQNLRRTSPKRKPCGIREEGRSAYYGWYEIRVQRDPAVTDPVIDTAGAAQRVLADALDSVGPTVLATLLAVLLLTAWAIRRRRAQTEDRSTDASSHKS
ncbi:hypothetical protein J7F02_27310 [Streptomyces sp. ISL-112]|uniref:hypothetical protein n=1 Tax=unclassified Streptomyces TaxID=2593676 RepID=UPI001BE6F463|nr:MULTISPECIES: hypothetical protein [unclassified Streptomyces]MBT2429228.1 hypothetical protein [Streptomyces sp. ISL-112]MBT2463558.1 hypothetical protein [Streptomyces sp. ISL-63]